MKRQLIEMTQDNLIVCDKPGCGYVVLNATKDPNIDIKPYINKPCPDCGENLLTQKDYDLALTTMNVVNWFNKWFSWLIIFSTKRPKPLVRYVHFHNGITITDKKSK